MAGTVKVLSDINNTREEITHIADLLSRRRFTKADITEIVKEQSMEAAIIAVSLGIFAALILTRIKSLLKLALMIYATKQSISYLLKK
ncbi:MAG: hypothetical protein A2039_08860 [Candidatus Melainabacteria bacterium GWA2_34_9]|nr:MAG: hypothetical protein A2039_08860 [Candidatus Melainabacteria bacterium GWA2_34_9]